MESIVEVSAFLVTLAGATWSAERLNLESRYTYWAGVWGILGALFIGYLGAMMMAPGAEIIWHRAPLEFLGGGKSVLFAFFGTALAGTAFLLLSRQPVLRHADAAVPFIALGYAVTRVGCYLKGDCFGLVSNVPWALTFASNTEVFAAHVAAGWIEPTVQQSLAVHPTQLYHAAAGVIAFIALSEIKGARPGTRLAAALLAYGVSRFAIEFYRGDAVPVWWMLDWNHLLCIAMVGIGAAVWMLRPAKDGAGSLRERLA